MPYKLKDSVRDKFEKKNYNKRDWKTYEQGLQDRGSLTIWFSNDAIKNWNAPNLEKKKRGRQNQYSDLAVETMLKLRLVYRNALRGIQAELTKAVNKYNTYRPHASIDNLTPMQYIQNYQP